MGETDPQLRRIERKALVTLAVLALAGVVSGGGWGALLGVCGGGLLVLVSYRAAVAGVDGALAGAAPGNAGMRRAAVSGLVKFITRFVILAAVAYVMMVRLRARPEWMLVGASSMLVAAALEALTRKRERPSS